MIRQHPKIILIQLIVQSSYGINMYVSDIEKFYKEETL